jgi:Fic family protein
MKFEQFKAGVWRQQFQYKSFSPILVNQQWTWEEPAINTLLEKANRSLGELNAFSLIVPDIDLFIQMHIVKEAQTSSKIEGTQTGIGEALMTEDQIAPEKRDDWHEVRNYIDAMNSAVGDLQNIPLSNRLLKQTHSILLRSVRGEHKQPGEFRNSQNWIGGSNLSDAVFIPPHQTEVVELMSDLEKFWHNEEITVPDLIRAAITHYQFETVHPFCDGNGRIGRLLIPLYLISKGLLQKPSLYLSDFFERNRVGYVEALMRVREANDLIHWVKFFLTGVNSTAEKGRSTFQKILLLRNTVEQEISNLGRRVPSARLALSLLYRKPVITVSELEQATALSTPTANALVKDFQRLNILKELSGTPRYRVFSFQRYLNLFIS